MPLCRNKECLKPFEKKAPNQVYCEDCSYWSRFEYGSVRKALNLAAPRLKAAADASGNPHIWRTGMPLGNLPEGMKKRVEMALRFGI